MKRYVTAGWWAFLLTLVVFADGWAWGGYVATIPTPFSCSTCHFNANGGGARNAFGRAYQGNGRSWTQRLCELDSDEDGVSNAAELGDPDCVWRRGQPRPAGPTSRPGDAGDTIAVIEVDCAGDVGGAAVIDECGRCVGGSTGLVACVEDCHGDLNQKSKFIRHGCCREGSILGSCSRQLRKRSVL